MHIFLTQNDHVGKVTQRTKGTCDTGKGRVSWRQPYQAAELQRSQIFGFPSVYVYTFDIKRQTWRGNTYRRDLFRG